MVNLYTLQEKNVRKTWIYLAFFLSMVVFLGWLSSYYYDNQFIFWFILVLSILMSIGSYWWSDKIVLFMSRARLIEKKDNPELYRLVENLAITAGLPLPRIYLIDDPSPNAFATGRDPQHAVVAVTRGLLEKLERVELEGVIAHELAHIGNWDTLLATVVVILVGLIIGLSDFFLRTGIKRDRDNRIGAVLFIFSLVFLILAPILAQLLRMAVSRKREFLADASGALLTRYPEGLARALEKIAQDPRSLKRVSNATAHLYIVSPFKGKDAQRFFNRLFSTHPPVEERIKALRAMDV